MLIDRAFEIALAENRKCNGWGENKVSKLECSIKFQGVPGHKIDSIDDYDLGIGEQAT